MAERLMPRPLSRGERRVDLWVNGLAIVAGVLGVVVLMAVVIPQGRLAASLSLLVYSIGMLAMLICSALYNGVGDTSGSGLLRRLDHAAIFVMIAGTYTPFLVKLDGDWSRWLLVYVWAVAGLGAAMKLLRPGRFERFSVVLYLFLGWTMLAAIEPLFASVSTPAIILLAAGGLLYSIGVLFHLWERLPYQQPIWHAFVLAAAVCHYVAVLGEIALPGMFT
jgi:hemolysin III